MAVAADLSPTTRLKNSQLAFFKSSIQHSFHKQLSYRTFAQAQNPRISCSVSSKQVEEASVAVKSDDSKRKPECFGVFCLTYDLKAEEETKSWKKMINIAVSGAAGMISNHLLFKPSEPRESIKEEQTTNLDNVKAYDMYNFLS